MYNSAATMLFQWKCLCMYVCSFVNTTRKYEWGKSVNGKMYLTGYCTCSMHTLLSSSLSAYTLVFSWHHSLISILRVEATSALSTSGTFVPRPFALRLPPFKLGKLAFLPLLVFPVNFVFREEKFLPLCVELRKPLRFRRLNWGCVCAFVPGESSSKPS